MWKRILIATLGIALVMALPAAANGRPDKPDKPGKPPPGSGRTCQELIDNGAMWDGGNTAYDAATGTYVGEISFGEIDGEPATGGAGVCIDIMPEHYPTGAWTVVWEVNVWDSGGSIEGFMLLFERGVHGFVYAEQEIPDPGSYAGATGTWTNVAITPVEAEPFVFVAMPDFKRVKRGDSGRITFTVSPPDGT